MYEKIKKFYDMGLYTAEQVYMFYNRGIITAEQYENIIGGKK